MNHLAFFNGKFYLPYMDNAFFAQGKFWKPPCASAVPQVTVQMIPHDGDGNVLVMHRSANVRSAPNVWSFPSGLHDIGETLEVGAERELFEEYGLRAFHYQQLGVYENIAGDQAPGPQFHWVIIMLAVGVYNLRDFENREPDKHDDARIVRADCLLRPEWRADHPFHSSLEAWLVKEAAQVVDKIMFCPCLHIRTAYYVDPKTQEHREGCLKCKASRLAHGLDEWEVVQ